MSMACGAAIDGDDDDAEHGRGQQWGHQLAKYLSCCGASQCAETHICSRRVAKAGAAACKQCGGGGGGTEWSKTFAAALCEIFDCPATVEREALDLVTSAVAFVSSPSAAAAPGDSDGVGGDGGGRGRNSGGSDGRAARRRGGGGSSSGAAAAAAAVATASSNANGESCFSSGSEGGLGSSWGSVSDLASACSPDDDAGHGNGAGASKSRWGGRVGEGAGVGNHGAIADDDDDDDDEVVRKGIWFPPPFTAGAQDPLLTSTSASASASTAGGARGEPRPRAALSAPQEGELEEDEEDEDPRRTKVLGSRSSSPSPPPSTTTTLAERLRRWHRFGAGAHPAAAAEETPPDDDESDRLRRRRRDRDRSPEGHEGELDAPLPLTPRGGGGGGGEDGAEFVVLVSREATVRELAASVGEFPPSWLVGAFGLVVRRQVEGAVYDARARAAVKRAVRLLDGRVSWKQVAITEKDLAALAQDQDTGRIPDGDQNKESSVSGRYWKVGLAAAGGGVLLFLSGGVAAPSVTASLSAVGFAAANSVSYVAPSLGAWLGYTSTTSAAAAAAAAATAATTGAASGAGTVGAFSAVSGAAGAGVAGYKMTRRTAGVQEFHFLPLHSNWPLDSPESMFEGSSEPGLPVFICVPGWHEPGHDPRHTWGGVGYAHANNADGGASTTTAIQGRTAPEAPPSVAWTAGRGDGDPKGRAATVPSPPPAAAAANAPTSASASATAAPVAELGGSGPEGARRAAPVGVGVGAGAGGAVSRWFSSSSATVGGNGTVSNGAAAAAANTAMGSARRSSPVPLAPAALESRDRRRGGRNNKQGLASDRDLEQHQHRRDDHPRRHRDGDRHQHHQHQHHHNRDPDGLGRIGGGGGGATAPAPMASSFIDLGVGRGARDGKTGGGAGGGGADGGLRAPCGEQEKGDLRCRQQRRRRNCVRDSGISEGGEAAAAVAVAGGGIDDDEGGHEDGEDTDAEKSGMEDSWEALPSHAWWRDFVSGGEEHVLVWERGPLTELHAAMRDLAWKKASRRAVNEALKRSALAPVVAAAALPLALLEAASGLDDPWGVVRSRALEAGRLLAAVLLSRPVGSRPVTLLGFSMGAKVVFNCLEALAAAPDGRGLGIVENAVMLGTPIGTKRGRWKRARSAVAGRLINGYSSRDWLLALVYRTKSWSVGVAGTSRVEGCGVENVDLSGLVTWHLSYSRILPTVMAMLRLEE